MAQLLDTEEAARRLGVKVATIYAYVSRGLLSSQRSGDGRRSLFAVEDIERLARRARGGKQVETRFATVTTAITHLDEAGPRYRGRKATDLATSHAFEEVAELLWQVSFGPGSWSPRPLDAPPPSLRHRDLIRWVVVMAGAADPLRADVRPAALTGAARSVMATLVDVLAATQAGGASAEELEPLLVLADGRRRSGSLAQRLTVGLAGVATERLVGAVNAAMVLMADHELATSTIAVRLAASTRAGLYDCALAGLGVLGGTLHGSASGLVHRMLTDAERDGTEQALSEALQWRGQLPGMGVPLYPEGDPRAVTLLELIADIGGGDRHRIVNEVLDAGHDRGYPEPNVDFALGALTFVAMMPADAGETVASVARLAGWTAHAVEELDQPPLRFRTRAVYAEGRSDPDPEGRR